MHKDFKDTNIAPTIKRFTFTSNRGVLESEEALDIQIYYETDSVDGEIYDTSVVNWKMNLLNDGGREIATYEWSKGHKDQTYNAGQHKIAIRANFKSGVNSGWFEHPFTVLQDKPIAVIATTPKELFGATSNPLKHASYDPNGDSIINAEWDGDILNEYPAEGRFVVRLRVQDSKGNWSDWTEKHYLEDRWSHVDLSKYQKVIYVDSSSTSNIADGTKRHPYKDLNTATKNVPADTNTAILIDKGVYTFVDKKGGVEYGYRTYMNLFGLGEDTVIQHPHFDTTSWVKFNGNTSFNKLKIEACNIFDLSNANGLNHYEINFNNVVFGPKEGKAGATCYPFTNGVFTTGGSPNGMVTINFNNSVLNNINRYYFTNTNNINKVNLNNSIGIVLGDKDGNTYDHLVNFNSSLENVALDSNYNPINTIQLIQACI